ncbi:variable large family protein (plasmid) [Borrelia coriaceae]|nr:variable large family protein [Borrelia coriaceae]
MEELEKRNTFLSSLANLGNDFLNIFTSFGEMTGTVLGFNKDTKKSDVGKYFKKVQDTVQGTKDKLKEIVANMEKENNPNADAVKKEVEKLVSEKLDTIIKGAKTVSDAIGTTGEDLLGNVAKAAASKAGGVPGTKVGELVEGIKGIVDVVLQGKGNSEAGDTKKAQESSSRSTGTDARKLFDGTASNIDSNAKDAANDASKAVAAVTGADILQAMVKDKGDAAKLAINNATVSGTSPIADSDARDVAIAGGIALRAMANGGKFANGQTNDIAALVQGIAVSAVAKVLNTLTIAIRNTIDTGLKTVKEAMKINPEATPVTTEAAGTVTK